MSEATVPMDDKALFDAATSDAAPVTETTTQEATTEQIADQGQPRDDHGRFAPKVEANPAAEAPKVEAQQPVVQQPAPAPTPQHEPPPGWLPAWRVREMVEAERRKAAPPPEPIDPWADLPKFTEQATRQAVDPIAQQLSATREYFSRKSAIATHGMETVQEAYKWLETATHAGDPKVGPLLQRITSSIDPFEDVVTAFKRDRAISTVGDDPNAWFEKEFERRAASDPAFKEKLAALHGQPQQQNGAAPATNVVKLPPSLNRQPGTAGNANAGTMSDADLYRSAIS